MNVTDRDLLAGEVVEISKKANAVVRYSDYGLERLGAMHAGLEAMGWGGKEAVGGKLHLTSYRLLFKSHGVNRLSGSFSVFLPSIDDVRDSSRGLARRMTVATASQELEFVVWGVPALMRAVVSARGRVRPAELESAIRAAANEPERLGSGLAKSDVIAKLLEEGNLSKVIGNAAEIASDPFGVATIVNVVEILEVLRRK